MSTAAHLPRDPDFAERCRQSFLHQPAMTTLFGARMVDIQAGACEIHLPLRPELLQQMGQAHGGVVGALADSAAGYSALSLMAKGLEVVTVEYKINFMAPAHGELLIGRGRVIRPGRQLFVCTAEIFAVRSGVETLCAYMSTTMMAVPDPKQP